MMQYCIDKAIDLFDKVIERGKDINEDIFWRTKVVLHSHLETVCALTLKISATCSWVRFFCCLNFFKLLENTVALNVNLLVFYCFFIEKPQFFEKSRAAVFKCVFGRCIFYRGGFINCS